MIRASLYACIAASCGLVLLAPLPARAADNLEGKYACEGSNPGGQPYRGKVEIAKDGDVYHMTWTIGAENYAGTGFVEGDTLCVSWLLPNKTAGVVVYKIKDKKLVGRWVQLGSKKILEETLTKE